MDAPTARQPITSTADRVVEALRAIGPASMPEVLEHLGGPVAPDLTVDIDTDTLTAKGLHIATVFDERTVRTDERRSHDGQSWTVWSLAQPGR
jgi:hypothetical protein